jgi:hypothetical protein
MREEIKQSMKVVGGWFIRAAKEAIDIARECEEEVDLEGLVEPWMWYESILDEGNRWDISWEGPEGREAKREAARLVKRGLAIVRAY